MSAEILRRAASLMRERATYAPPSPWAVDARSDGRVWIDVPEEDDHAWAMHGLPAAAKHIASWHPAVALAVADWLEDEADEIPDFGGEVMSKWGPIENAPAFKVARAYLDEPT